MGGWGAGPWGETPWGGEAEEEAPEGRPLPAGDDIWLDMSAENGPDRAVTAAGDWLLATGQVALRQSLLRRFLTAPGEWAMKPDYGAGARLYVKAKNTKSTRDELSHQLREQALKDDRVRSVETVVVDLSASTVKFTVRIMPRGELAIGGPLTISGEAH